MGILELVCLFNSPTSCRGCMLTLQMLMLLFAVFVALEAAPAAEDANGIDKIIYDQRQSGKYNIQVSIKDVAIIEVNPNDVEDEGFDGEDNYYYDDDDLTVKPIKFTTVASIPNATNQTTTAAATAAATSSELAENSATTTTSGFTTGDLRIAPNGLPTNVTYSTNLLADIAATRVASTKKTKPTRPQATNVVIVESSTTHYPSPSSTHLPSATLLPAHIRARTKDIPILAINDHNEVQPQQNQQKDFAPLVLGNSRIFKVKVQQPHVDTQQQQQQQQRSQHATRCRAHQYRDSHGICRSKRSSSSAAASASLLKKLFKMLVSLPFANSRTQQQQAAVMPTQEE